MIVLFPLFGLGVTNVPYSIAYLWTLFALAAGALGTLALVLLLKKTFKISYEAQEDK
jgi:hypothetical protein